MKYVLDACVLYPTVMREILLGATVAGLVRPLWSDKILEEWARAARKRDPEQEAQARGEIAVLRARWPDALVKPAPELQATLYLPDANDTHVLATAITGGARVIVTMNLRDFPKRLLEEFSILARHPDEFLLELYNQEPDIVADLVEQVRREAERLSGHRWPVRKLLKKARLPRLGKALEGINHSHISPD
ncbi:MAG: PIN domain-containing protein [Paracoccaceae bacterium]